MIVLNFAGKMLDQDQIESIQKFTGIIKFDIIDVHLEKINPDLPLESQIEQIFDDQLSRTIDYQPTNILVALPESAPAAVLVMAGLQGRLGIFPSILRQRDQTITGIINVRRFRRIVS